MRTKSCRRLKDADLAAYTEGGLSPAYRNRIVRHLDTCPACRLAVAQAAKGLRASELLRDDLAAAPVPAMGFAGVMERIRLETAVLPGAIPAGRSRSVWVTILRRLPALSAVAAAMLAVVFLVPILFSGNQVRHSNEMLTAIDQQSRPQPVSGQNTDLAPAFVNGATQQADMAQKGAEAASTTASRLPEDVKASLAAAGITGDIRYTLHDGVSVLAVHFSRDVNVATAREILDKTVKTALLPCGTLPVIAIMEGETPLASDDSPENRRIQEALGFLPRAEASIPDSPGIWLILTWQVKD